MIHRGDMVGQTRTEATTRVWVINADSMLSVVLRVYRISFVSQWASGPGRRERHERENRSESIASIRERCRARTGLVGLPGGLGRRGLSRGLRGGASDGLGPILVVEESEHVRAGESHGSRFERSVRGAPGALDDT